MGAPHKTPQRPERCLCDGVTQRAETPETQNKNKKHAQRYTHGTHTAHTHGTHTHTRHEPMLFLLLCSNFFKFGWGTKFDWL